MMQSMGTSQFGLQQLLPFITDDDSDDNDAFDDEFKGI